MSNAARALLDDVKARRDQLAPSISTQSPFPDFDRTLQNLTGGDGEFGGFSFNLDPKLAGDGAESTESLPDFEIEARTPFTGTYIDAFPALRSPAQVAASPFIAPPGLSYPHNPTRSIYDPLAVRPSQIETQSIGSSNYMGSFNPFADGSEEATGPLRRGSTEDDSPRKVSRFGFARGRQGSATSSPLHASSPLSHSASFNDSTHTFYNSTDFSHSPAQSQYSMHGYQQPGSATGSPLVQHAQAQQHVQPPPDYLPQSRFQPFDSGVSEAQLRDLIQSSRERGVSYNGMRSSPTGRIFLFG